MQHLADTSTVFSGAVSVVDAASADLARGSRDREKRQREEPQLSSAEHVHQLGSATPVQLGSAEHAQLGSAEHVQRGSAEHLLLFLAAVVDVKVCRGVRNVTIARFNRKKNKAHRAELASDNSKVDKAFAQAAALSEGIQLETLTPRVYDSQWQPASYLERQRVTANKRLEAANITRSAASASGHSTPSRHQKQAANALQNEIKRLDSSTKLQGVMKFMPALEYDNGKLREHCVSNVHSRGAGQCYEMCLVPCTNDAFSVEFVAVPGDVAFLHALQAFVDVDSVLEARHVVSYHNRKLSDHKITLIKSW